MKLTVDASQLDIPFMAMESAAQMSEKKDFNTGSQKTTEDGKGLYAARGLKAIQMRDGMPSGSDDSVSLALVNPAPITFSRLYKLTGTATITHYVQGNGRLGVSIVADGITEMKPADTSNNK